MKLKDRIGLVDGWRKAHKFASVRLAALAGLVVAYFAAYPDQWQAVLHSVPEAYRPLVGLLVFAMAGGSRVVSLRGPQDAQP